MNWQEARVINIIQVILPVVCIVIIVFFGTNAAIYHRIRWISEDKKELLL